MRTPLLTAALAATLLSPLTHAGEPAATILLLRSSFDVTEVTVSAGQTVRWTLTDGMHTVTSPVGQPDPFDSGMMMFGDLEVFEHTFNTAGDYNFYCQMHGFDTGNGQVIGMAGVVHVLPPPVCSPADIGVQGGTAGHDNLLNNNDFVVFINLFFTHDPAADVGVQGGTAGQDTLWDNNDFVVFINFFFNGAANCTG